jgi:PAS domain S-box-containing protein
LEKVKRLKASERSSLVLFLASGEFSFELMAEGLVQRIADDSVSALSAASKPTDPHPLACEVMREVGVELSELTLRTPLDVEVFSFDLVVTLGSFDPSYRVNLAGMPPHFHWDLPALSDEGGRDVQLDGFRAVRDRLEAKINELVAADSLSGLQIARQNMELILDNLADGVMAHTMNRRIFYFNTAAERLTGFKREDVLGRDCHKVFRPKRFCGGDCSFCNGEADGQGRVIPKKAQVTFTQPRGEELSFDMSIMPLADAQKTEVGALVSFKDNTELANLKRGVPRSDRCGKLIGRDPKTLALFEQIREVGPVNVPVLIEGESGTGKELVARAVHELSERAAKPLIVINCGALPEGLLESELFGHVRGAFTGAMRDKKGRFELADGGSIFLDEVAELSPALQVKLLRVLQERRFRRIGDEKVISVDVRIISATNRNLQRLKETGRFRSDLFYRLCVVPVRMPPLRDRCLDIPILVDHFLESIAEETGRPRITSTDEALDLLVNYPWPGNVRELRNALQFVYVKCQSGTLTPHHLPKEIQNFEVRRTSRPGPALKLKHEDVLAALGEARGNKSKAAEILGVGRSTLYRFLAQQGLKPE